MVHWWTVFGPVLAIFGVIVAGVVLRRLEVLTEEADRSLLRLVVNVLAPCLIFKTVVGNPALREPANVWLPPVVGFGTAVLGFVVALGVARVLGKAIGVAGRAQAGTFAFCVGVFNYGYIPIPLVEQLYAGESATGRATMGVLFVHNVGVEVAMFTVGLAILAGAGGAGRGFRGRGFRGWRAVVNPPSVAIVVAVLLNFVDWSFLPGFVAAAVGKGVGMLGDAMIPLALVLIGATVADHLRDLRGRGSVGTIAGAAMLRLGLLPVAFLGLAWALMRMPAGARASDELVRVMVIEAAMPSAVFPIVLAKHYGGDAATALRVVLGTSVIGLVTIPLWVAVGLWVVGV